MRGRRVIVGVSGSIASLAALRFGLNEVEESGGVLYAVLAWSPPGGEATARCGMPPPLVEVWTAMATERLTTAFDEAVGGVPSDIDVRLEVRRGEAGPVLTGAADDARDLLVLGGTRQMSAPRPSWWPPAGRVRRHCQRHARCPLVFAPPPDLSCQPLRIGFPARWWTPATFRQ